MEWKRLMCGHTASEFLRNKVKVCGTNELTVIHFDCTIRFNTLSWWLSFVYKHTHRNTHVKQTYYGYIPEIQIILMEIGRAATFRLIKLTNFTPRWSTQSEAKGKAERKKWTRREQVRSSMCWLRWCKHDSHSIRLNQVRFSLAQIPANLHILWVCKQSLVIYLAFGWDPSHSTFRLMRCARCVIEELFTMDRGILTLSELWKSTFKRITLKQHFRIHFGTKGELFKYIHGVCVCAHKKRKYTCRENERRCTHRRRS